MTAPTTPAPSLDWANGNEELARVGITGGVVKGKLGTTVPMDLDPWSDAVEDLGYLSDDGLTEAVDADSEEFTPWQSNQPIRVEYTKETWTFQATFWESKYSTLSTYYRASREDWEELPNGVVVLRQKAKPKRQRAFYGFDIIDGDVARRIVLPNAEVTDRDDVVYKSDTVIGYNVTITAFPVGGVAVVRLFLENWDLPDLEA